MYMAVIDRGRTVAAHVRARAAVQRKDEVRKEGQKKQRRDDEEEQKEGRYDSDELEWKHDSDDGGRAEQKCNGPGDQHRIQQEEPQRDGYGDSVSGSVAVRAYGRQDNWAQDGGSCGDGGLLLRHLHGHHRP